jgi:hypothetical protein
MGDIGMSTNTYRDPCLVIPSIETLRYRPLHLLELRMLAGSNNIAASASRLLYAIHVLALHFKDLLENGVVAAETDYYGRRLELAHQRLNLQQSYMSRANRGFSIEPGLGGSRDFGARE